MHCPRYPTTNWQETIMEKSANFENKAFWPPFLGLIDQMWKMMSCKAKNWKGLSFQGLTTHRKKLENFENDFFHPPCLGWIDKSWNVMSCKVKNWKGLNMEIVEEWRIVQVAYYLLTEKNQDKVRVFWKISFLATLFTLNWSNVESDGLQYKKLEGLQFISGLRVTYCPTYPTTNWRKIILWKLANFENEAYWPPCLGLIDKM